ncbi:unnamed protein product [Arctia plantaginis]|uniref:Carboxylesterase type B domain-containing protein n=1 Tax=Arctia plantaginis TaxID=874455 RepID=A0A8S1A3R7_ARCPL|nr:unnamed protein product [Arctia plantaginis]
MLSIRYEEAKAAAFETFNAFQHMFITCAMSTMPEQHFKSGELKNFVNYPPKTTIGLAPKFTSNRKYFANLISSIGFKTMLANDEEEIRRDKVFKKMTSTSEDLKCILETKDGPICGYIDKIESRTYYKFKSIPYAKPPIGKLRFMPPTPLQPWKDILNCTNDAPLPICPSLDKESLYSITGSEDCLYLEVSTPNIKPKEPMPVMFWIGSYSFAYYIDNISTLSVLTNDHNVIFVKCEIVDELRSMSACEIMTAFKKMSLEIRNGVNNDVIDTVFKPCIEIEFEGQPAFLTKSPVLIMNSGNFHKVPLMIGSNNIADANLKLMNKDTVNFDKINDNVCLLVPRSLAAEDKLSKNIGHQLLKFYLGGDARLTNDTTTQYLQLISDYYFSYYVNKSVRIHTEVAPEIPIYYFIINRAPEWAMPKEVNFLGALEQSDKFPIVFRIEMPKNGKHCRDLELTRKKVLKMWSNFAKFGNPTPDDNDPLLQITWDPVENKDRLNYLCIGSEITKGRNPFHERMKFWDKLHQDHKFLRTLVYLNDIGCSW